MWSFLHKLASPPHFYGISARMIPWFYAAGLLAVAYGSVAGLFYAPADEEMNDGFRIIYVHVPAAFISMSAYMVMAIGAGIGLIWRMKLAHAVAAGAAPLGAWFTFLALITGSIWGRPMWGTWWEWGDPRLTSELLLLFLYFGYMALRAAIDDTAKADKASAVLAWSVPSISRSSTFRSSGGPRCTRDRPCSSQEGRRCIRTCCTRCWQ